MASSDWVFGFERLFFILCDPKLASRTVCYSIVKAFCQQIILPNRRNGSDSVSGNLPSAQSITFLRRVRMTYDLESHRVIKSALADFLIIRSLCLRAQQNLGRRLYLQTLMPQQNAQPSHARNHGNFFVFRITRHDPIIRHPFLFITPDSTPDGLTQYFPKPRWTFARNVPLAIGPLSALVTGRCQAQVGPHFPAVGKTAQVAHLRQINYGSQNTMPFTFCNASTSFR